MCKLFCYTLCNGSECAPVVPKECNKYVFECPVCGCRFYSTVANCPDCLVAFKWSKFGK